MIRQKVPTSMTKKHCPIEVLLSADAYSFADNDFNLTRIVKYRRCDMWHQVILHHDGKYGMSDLIDALFEVLTPHDFYPCYYRTDTNRDTFFVRNSYEQMELLFSKKLQIPMPDKRNLCISLKMNAVAIQKDHVNPAELIQTQISVCFNLINKTLDLSHFAAHQKLEEIVLRMSVPRILTNILSFASRKYSTNVELLKLNGNGLKSARGMHPIIWMKSLKEIDLRNNNIENISDLSAIPKATIVVVWLSGNPLCMNYMRPNAYADAARETLPNLVKLDGEDLDQYSTIVSYSNYLCDINGYELVEQFVEQYFKCFDSPHRSQSLRGECI